MDARELKFESGTFDIVLDKGTFDALFCKSKEDLKRGVEEVWRVMKDKDTSLLIVLSNAPLMEVVDVLKKYFDVGMNSMVRNEKVGQMMAKQYVLKRRKKIIK